MNKETIISIFFGICVLSLTILIIVIVLAQFDPNLVYNCNSYECVECINCGFSSGNIDVLSQFTNVKNTLISLGIVFLLSIALLLILSFFNSREKIKEETK